MNIVDDIKNVSEAALGKLSAQFGDLPRPLLAAIGAGDVAVERLAKLREHLKGLGDDEQADADESASGGSRIGELAGKAQKVMEDVAHRLADAAEDVSDKAQQLIADLPAKAQEVANSLSREKLRSTVEGYTQRVADVYKDLADRGGDKVHTSEEAAAAKESAAPKPPMRKAAPVKPAADKKPAVDKKPVAKKPATKKPATKKPAAAKPTTEKKPAAKKPEAEKKPDAMKPASPDSDAN